MLSMLKEQKYVPLSSRSHDHNPLTFLSKIDGTTQKLKMLINSFRDRSLKGDESFDQDEDFSKNEVVTENRSLKMNRERRWQNERLNHIVQSPRLTGEMGDIKLANRPAKPNLAKVQKLAKLSKHGVESSQSFPQTKITLPPFIPSPSSSFKQSHQGTSQFLVSPSKKQPTFRISSKLEEKRKIFNDLLKKKEQPEEDPFEVQSINAYLIVSHLHSIRDLEGDSNPEQIFAFFESIYSLGRFPPPKNAVIKRYKNCIYYGDKPKKEKNEVYRGMISYFKKSLYYGQMVDNKKHGTGIEINLGKKSVVWKGKFINGKKTGYFSMESNEAKYYGMVKDGEYHGEGHLITLESEYKGVFCEGVKEGMGVQKMGDRGQYKGEYFNNKFDGEGELKAQGYYFQGMFKEGKPDGRGFERTEQYQYLGDFVMGVKEGKGKIKTNDGVTMECRFWNGLAIDQNAKIPKKINNLILEPNLSKELGALNQQSDEGTIDHVLNAFSKF